MRVLFCLLAVITITTIFAAEIEKQDVKTEKKEVAEIEKQELKSSQTNFEDAKIEEPVDISPTSAASEHTEVTRKKKSTTTTFCVEIRPSGPYQKPFQVCEPAEPSKPGAYSAPDGNYYAAPSYGEQPKTQVPYQPASNPAYKPVSQAKPAPAYSAPVKTFSAPSVAPAESHSSMYSSYRSKNAEGANQEHHNDHLMRAAHVSAEDQTSSERMRSASYGSASYGSASYGAPTSFIPVVPKEKQKGNAHNGLVITCQPNLAGYAHNVPSSFHHPSAVSYNYRAAVPIGYGGRGYGRYRVQVPSYGNVHQAPGVGPGPVLKPLVSVSSDQISKPLAPSPASYGPDSPIYRNQPYESQHVPQYEPSPIYSSQVSTHSSRPVSSGPSYARPPPPPPPISSFGPPPAPQRLHPSALPQPPNSAGYTSQSYASYSQAQSSSGQSALVPASASIAPGPAVYGPAPTGYTPGPTPAVYGPAPPAPIPGSGIANVVYGPAPPPVAVVPAPPPPAPPAPAYVPPGTYYREAEEDSKATNHPIDKEAQTLKKMHELSQQRAKGTQWESEMSTDGSQQKKTDDHVQAPHQGWSSRSSEGKPGDSEGVESTEMAHDTKNNEVDH